VTFFIHFLICAYASNISELLNGFASNSQRGRVWSLDRTSLNVRVKGQGHQGQKTDFGTPIIPAATERSRLLHAAVTLTFDLDIQGPCVRLMFGKTSLALVWFVFVN